MDPNVHLSVSGCTMQKPKHGHTDSRCSILGACVEEPTFTELNTGHLCIHSDNSQLSQASQHSSRIPGIHSQQSQLSNDAAGERRRGPFVIFTKMLHLPHFKSLCHSKGLDGKCLIFRVPICSS